MPALANVALTDTFDTWRIRTNQLIIKTNDDELATIAAYDKANSANVLAYNTGIGANTFLLATLNGANTLLLNTIAGANAAVGTGANTYLLATMAGANAAVGIGANSFTITTLNGANTLLLNTIAGANAAVGTGANTYLLATIAGANAAVGTAANNISIAAFAKANAALANSTTTYVGNLTVGDASSTMNVVGRVSIASANVLSQTLTDDTTINWDTSLGQVAYVTIANNRTIAAPTNLRVGTLILHVIQDGTGGRTLTWNSVFKWPAGVAPVLTTTANRRDLFSFVCDGTNLYGSFLPDVR
jgi:hypothetical protein